MRQRKFENIRARRALRESNEYDIPADLMEVRQGLYSICNSMHSITHVIKNLSNAIKDYDNLVDDRIVDEIDDAFNYVEEYFDEYERAKNQLQTILYRRTRR